MRPSATFVLLVSFSLQSFAKALETMAIALAAALLILLLAAPAVHAVQHTVGGSDGWSQSADLPTWASGETFTVGDTLLFTYSSSHNVDVVSQGDYNNCNSGNALKSYNGGKTTISLDTAGPMYFMCPTFGHCQGGMKLAINVVAAASSTPSSGTTPATPSTPSAGSSSPGTTTSLPPPHGGATGNFGYTKQVMLGFSLILAFIG